MDADDTGDSWPLVVLVIGVGNATTYSRPEDSGASARRTSRSMLQAFAQSLKGVDLRPARSVTRVEGAPVSCWL